MHDPKFEKEVQQKMEELTFIPSEAVWTNVSLHIGRKKERRLAPVFWISLLAGSLLLGAAGLYLLYTHKEHNSLVTIRANQDPKSTAILARPDKNSGGWAGHQEKFSRSSTGGALSDKSTATPSVSSGHAPENKTGIALVDKQAISNSRHGQTSVIITSKAGNTPANTGNTSANKGSRSGRKTDGQMTGASLQQAEASVPASTDPVYAEAGTATRNGQSLVELAPLDRDEPGDLAALLKAPFLPNINSTAGLPGPGANRAAKNTNLHKKAVWEAGFTGGAGFSTANERLIGAKTSNLMRDVVQPSSSFAGLAAAAAPSKTYTSRTNADLSFLAGIFARRPLSRRVAVTLGLNLHYYSTKVEITEKGGYTSISAANSLFNATSYAAPAPSPAPPEERHESVNQYYFLELPVSLQWQVNRSPRMPLFWEGGLSVSRLMSANVLYFDVNSGTYFKDGRGITNSTQLSASTALLLGLSFRGTRLQVGPQVQFGLTALTDERITGTKHLFYGGIKFAIIPGKRK